MLELLHDGRAKIAVVGLGYVGLPLAVAFSRHFSVIGYDSDEEDDKREQRKGRGAAELCTGRGLLVEVVSDGGRWYGAAGWTVGGGRMGEGGSVSSGH